MALLEDRHLTNERLADLCKEQNELFKEDRSASDSRYCYELLRRAVFRVDGADKLVYQIYYPSLERKIVAALPRPPAEVIEDLCQDTLLRFFRYVTLQTWSNFPTLAHLLAYMDKCCQTAIVNYQRKAVERQKFELAFLELEDERTPSASSSTRRPTEQRFSREQLKDQVWDCIKRNCNDADDYFLARQLWLYGLKPRELVQRFEDRFPEAVDVYKRKRNLIDRMRRDSQFRKLAGAMSIIAEDIS